MIPMHKIQVFIGFCTALFLAFGVSSAKEIWNFPIKNGNLQEIDKAFSSMTTHKIIRGNFKQTKTIQNLNKTFVSTGKFTIENGKGIFWNTQSPFASQIAITETKMIQQTVSGRTEINTSENVTFSQISQTIQSVFAGNTSKLKANFDIFFKQEGNVWTIGLVPKEPTVKKVIANIELSGKTWLESIKLIDPSSSPLVYEFSNASPAEQLNEEESEFLGK